MTIPATMTFAEFRQEMRIGKTKFYEMRNVGDIPPTFTYGAQERILRSDFDRWLAEKAGRKEAA